MKKHKLIPIICPSCREMRGTYDGRSTIDKMVICRKCNKSVIYRVSTGETENKALPKRNCSSGKTFI